MRYLNVIKLLFAITISLVPMAALAEKSTESACSQAVTNKLHSQFGYEYDPDYPNYKYYVCKALPNSPDKTVVAMVLVGNKVLSSGELYYDSANLDQYDGLDLNIFIISSDGEKIYAQLFSKGVIDLAPTIQSISIDTGRYYLEKGSTIFGIRVRSEINSPVTIGSFETLSLYKYKNNAIAEILDRLETSSYSGENNCYGSSGDPCNCPNSQYSKSNTTLSLATTTSHGMYDIIIHTVTKNIEESCTGKEKTTPAQDIKSILQYNGSIYPHK